MGNPCHRYQYSPGCRAGREGCPTHLPWPSVEPQWPPMAVVTRARLSSQLLNLDPDYDKDSEDDVDAYHSMTQKILRLFVISRRSFITSSLILIPIILYSNICLCILRNRTSF